MQFSPHKPHNVPERFAASVAKVCTTATARTFRFGAGVQDADFFIPSDAAYRGDARRPPICTESEADSSKMALPQSV